MRMQATMATFLGLPAALKRLWKSRIAGLCFSPPPQPCTARTHSARRPRCGACLAGPESSAGRTPRAWRSGAARGGPTWQRCSQRQDRHRPDPFDAVEQRTLVLEVAVDVVVDLPIDGCELLVQRLEHAGDAASAALAGVNEGLFSATCMSTNWRRRVISSASAWRCSSSIGVMYLARSGWRASTSAKSRGVVIDLVGLGQHAHGLRRECTRLPGLTLPTVMSACRQAAYQAALIPTRGLKYHQIDRRPCTSRSARSIHSHHWPHADPACPGRHRDPCPHVDSGVGPLITTRYPTLRMHVHD